MTKFSQEIKNERDELYRITFAIEIFEQYVSSKATIKDFREVLKKKKEEQEEIIYNLKNKTK